MLRSCFLLFGFNIVYQTLCISSPNPFVTRLTDPIDHAEGPSWSTHKNLLYYVDIHTGRVLTYNPETFCVNSITLFGNATPVVPSKDDPDVLIVGVERQVVAVKWNGLNTSFDYRVLTTVSKQFPDSRFNDGKADKQGRLWFGTMGYEDANGVKPNQGVFYLIDAKNLEEPLVKLAPVNISNGLAWNKANDKLYYIDTPTRKIVKFNYRDENADIVYDGVAFDFAKYASLVGNPDGMTIDVEDNLWIAIYGGASVIKVNPNTGELLQRVEIPARDVTSAIWGGNNLDVLFVTTSRVALNDEERKLWPYAGSVFAVTGLGTKGLPVFGAESFGAFKKKPHFFSNNKLLPLSGINVSLTISFVKTTIKLQ